MARTASPISIASSGKRADQFPIASKAAAGSALSVNKLSVVVAWIASMIPCTAIPLVVMNQVQAGQDAKLLINGMEVTQFTYFQQVGGLECYPVTGEITYGLERIAMYLQGVDSIFDLVWTINPNGEKVTYGDVFHQNEVEMSRFNFEQADVEFLLQSFDVYERESQRLVAEGLPLPAYEMVMKASHTFNLLDARHAISVTERQRYILRVRTLARTVAEAYFEARRALGFPLAGGGGAVVGGFLSVRGTRYKTHNLYLVPGTKYFVHCKY